jgi:glutamate decarboxylase
MVPAYTLPPDADKEKIMRALVKLTLGRSLVDKLADDMEEATKLLAAKGALPDVERKRAKIGPGH